MTSPGDLTRSHYQRLILAVGLTDLTEDERRLIEWLSGWDQWTVETTAGLFDKLIRPATPSP